MTFLRMAPCWQWGRQQRSAFLRTFMSGVSTSARCSKLYHYIWYICAVQPVLKANHDSGARTSNFQLIGAVNRSCEVMHEWMTRHTLLWHWFSYAVTFLVCVPQGRVQALSFTCCGTLLVSAGGPDDCSLVSFASLHPASDI